MLKLKNISKDYVLGNTKIHALKNVSLEFRKNEFVSILGPSGCGKTTLLNIIGGLDRYTYGDLFINSTSTKSYNSRDWDAYRNNSVGFVFQNYNLIPHLSVLGNVELALTLSGVSKIERTSRSIEVLEKVGLSDQIYKKPNQLSGGQMQRVAIARALVNDPDIILADEPTGALDSTTSVQVMDILKEIAYERLVIMVTHNAALAKSYSNRIIQLLDGEVVGDNNVYESHNEKVLINNNKDKESYKTSMSFVTALMLSLKNLITKKTRTFMTAFAGSIGIIGIALVLSLSNGFSSYINKMQTDTMSGSPIAIGPTAFGDLSSYRRVFPTTGEFPNIDVIYPRENFNQSLHNNIITEDYIEYVKAMDSSLYNSISFNRGVALNRIRKTIDAEENVSYTRVTGGWGELIENQEFLASQYDVLKGKLPTSINELVLVVDSYNRISARTFTNLGIDYEVIQSLNFDYFLGMEFKIVTNNQFYTYNIEAKRFLETPINTELYENKNNITVSIVGILRVKQDTVGVLSDGIFYTPELTNEILKQSEKSEVVDAQITQMEEGTLKNVITGNDFSSGELGLIEYRNLMVRLGGMSIPTSIDIYPVSFASRELIKNYLNEYNYQFENDSDKIMATDMLEIISTSMNTLVNTISYVLIAFAAISLVVSSIMIGIITYVSVIERTKEIGVLRSLGARKRDITRVFNAETILIGFAAGVIGVLVSALLTIPINLIITRLVDGVESLAVLKPIHALFLVIISMLLTLVSGLIPARIAANKDPVVALRTE